MELPGYNNKFPPFGASRTDAGKTLQCFISIIRHGTAALPYSRQHLVMDK